MHPSRYSQVRPPASPSMIAVFAPFTLCCVHGRCSAFAPETLPYSPRLRHVMQLGPLRPG